MLTSRHGGRVKQGAGTPRGAARADPGGHSRWMASSAAVSQAVRARITSPAGSDQLSIGGVSMTHRTARQRGSVNVEARATGPAVRQDFHPGTVPGRREYRRVKRRAKL